MQYVDGVGDMQQLAVGSSITHGLRGVIEDRGANSNWPEASQKRRVRTNDGGQKCGRDKPRQHPAWLSAVS